MSQSICSICSNKGPDKVHPILPQTLFCKYLLQFGVNNKINFITSSYREHIHFRCAFFIPKLRWVKEVFHGNLDYVCFGLEWILTQKNKEAMCAVCQKSTRAKVLLSCAGGEHDPCNKRYHIDCVIAVRKRIYYKPGQVTLLCNEHFSQGKSDPQNRVLDWVEFESIVKRHIENCVISRDQEYQNYITEASVYPRPPEMPDDVDPGKIAPIIDSSIQNQKSTQMVNTSYNRQSQQSNSKDREEKDDIMNQYSFRPRALFDIDYSGKNPMLNQPTKKRSRGGNNGNQQNANKSQTRETSSVESSIQERQLNSVGPAIDRQIYNGSVEKPKSSAQHEVQEQKTSFSKQTEERKSKPPSISMLEDNDDINIFARYETKKHNPLGSQFKKQMVQDPPKEQLTKPQLQQLERQKQPTVESQTVAQNTTTTITTAKVTTNLSVTNQINQNHSIQNNNHHENESQNKIKQLQQDLEESHNETNNMQYLGRRQIKLLQQQQSIITPKIKFKRQIPSSDEETQQQEKKKLILPKTNYKIDILSQVVPVYPFDEEEKRWESMNAWWSKIDEFFFTQSEFTTDFRDQSDIEITLQPTVELLKKTYLSVLFQNQLSLQNYMVHYTIDPTVYQLEKSSQNDLPQVTVFDRNLNQVDKTIDQNDQATCTLQYLEALEMTESELKDSLKLHQAIVSSSQQNELDVMYYQMMKEFEELNDRNSANIKQLQLKLSQFQAVDLLGIIQEGVSIVDQLRWNEIIKCFENGFLSKDASVMQSYEITISEGFKKIMHLYEKQNEKQHLDTDCQVCFSGVTMQLNNMVYCDQCSASFHQYCYGILEDDLINSNTFKCDKCKGQSKKACYICKKKHSPMPLKQIKNNYFHPTCIVLYDYLSLQRPLQLTKGVTLNQIDQTINPSVDCSLCLKKKGRKIKCRECENQYHILCAYLNGFEVTVKHKERKISVEIACGVHTISLQKLVEQIFYRRYPINYDEAASYESSEIYYEARLKENAQFKQVKKIFECESIELIPRKKVKPNN